MLLWHILVCCASLSTAISTHRETHFLRGALNKQHRYSHTNKHNRHHYHATKKHPSLSEHPYPPELEKIFGVEISNETESVVCRTKECKQMAKIMKRNMDTSVNPCDDFYQYACGKFGENNPIPAGEDSWSFIAMTEKSLELQLQEILEEEPKPNDLITVKMGKRFFRTCIDLESREKKGEEQLVTTVTRIGGWPMIMEPDEWDETTYTWQKVEDYYAALSGHHVFYEVKVYKTYENVSLVNIALQHLPLGANRLKEEEESSEASWNTSSDDEDEDEDDYEDKDENEDEDKDKDDDNDDENEDETKFKSKNKNKLKKKLQHKLRNKKKSKLMAKRLSVKLRSKNRNKLRNKIKNKIRTKRSDGNDDSKPRNSQESNSNENDSIDISISSTEDKRNLTEEYADLIAEVAMQLAKVRGAEITKNSIAADINDLLLFMKKLIALTEEDIYEADKEMTLGEFQQWQKKVCTNTDNGKINWIQKLTLLFSIANIEIDENLSLDVDSVIFYKHLAALLDETPSRTIVNYIHWYYISIFISATTEKMKDLHHQIANAEKSSEETNLKEECVSEVGLNDIISYAFVKKFFPDEIKKTGEEMIENIQKEVLRQIAESEWLDEERRIYTTEKVQNIRKFIGYPNWYTNTTLMKSYYKGLSVGPSYFENKISYTRYHKKKNLQLLNKENPMENSIEAYVIPLMLNAMFAAFENAMIVTAADFQNPFFALSRPQVINYGIIGAIMGHEINHGFDDDGMKFDKTGTRVEWISSMAEAFSKRVDCFIDQYDDLARKNRLFNKTTEYTYGNRTKGENIADTMGLEAALGAYRISRKNKGNEPEELLPGLEDFSTDQLFFLSYANTFCEVLGQSRLKSYRKDVHSPGQLRVLGPISNSENFAKAFNCPVGSPMNPEKKCNIWK